MSEVDQHLQGLVIGWNGFGMCCEEPQIGTQVPALADKTNRLSLPYLLYLTLPCLTLPARCLSREAPLPTWYLPRYHLPWAVWKSVTLPCIYMSGITLPWATKHYTRCINLRLKKSLARLVFLYMSSVSRSIPISNNLVWFCLCSF